MRLNIKVTRFDQVLIDLLIKYHNVFFFTIITILAIVSRNHFRGYLSGDMANCIEPWTAYLKANGGFSGIPTLQSNYTVLYQYMMAFVSYLPGSTIAKMKVISWIFDFIAAVFVALFVSKLTNRPKFSMVPILAYTTTLFAPTIFTNSSLWGQCDIIYAGLVLISLYLLTNNSYGWSFVIFGIALSFKLQAIFVLPLFLILYFKNKNFSLLHFLYIPTVYLFLYLPALILGKPFNQFLLAYNIQINNYPSMVLNFPNFYALIPDDYALFSTPAILLTFVLIGCVAYLVTFSKKITLDDNRLIELGLILVMICVYFLPSMHDRYLFMADLLGVIYLFIKPKRFYVPILIWFTSFMTYLPYLFGTDPWIDYRLASFVLFGILMLLIYDFFKPIINNKPTLNVV